MPDSESPAGRLVGGRYRLIAKLGAGGYGRVWRARDEKLGQDVAVKEVWFPAAVSPSDRAERVQRAEREARNAARLRGHRDIVAVLGVVVEEGMPWTVMQLISGHSLAEHLDRYGPLAVRDAGRVATAVLRALGAAHAAGVVHRDVKPANVMLTEAHEVVLTDFGIAVGPADTVLTEPGSFIGSVEYIAPERIRGEDGLAVSDLFSLGATVYHAVEGFSPFHRPTPTGSLSAVLFDQAAPPKRAGLLTGVVQALMDKDPARRPSVGQALAMIDRALGTGGGRGGTDPVRGGGPGR